MSALRFSSDFPLLAQFQSGSAVFILTQTVELKLSR
jgi:hypothetical protein